MAGHNRSILIACASFFLVVRYIRETRLQRSIDPRRGLQRYIEQQYIDHSTNQEHERHLEEVNRQNDTGCLSVKEEIKKVEERCALCFFGLPRSYQSLVLPGIINNVFTPNADNKCDVFVHYYHQDEEAAGRKNKGGKMNASEIFLVENAARSILGSNTTVIIVNDTDASFREGRKYQIERYQNALGKDGFPAYFPYKSVFKPESLVNMLKQWHSIATVFSIMDDHMTKNNINYTRVAMLRNDVMFITPFNITMVDNTEKTPDSKHFVLPGFANFPVTDRMIYGHYGAVKIWSTSRFELAEQRAWEYKHPGTVMHSERMMATSMLPSIEKAGYKRLRNDNVCFFRTRAESVALFMDCVRGVPKGLENANMTGLIEKILGRRCQKVDKDMVSCPPPENFLNSSSGQDVNSSSG